MPSDDEATPKKPSEAVRNSQLQEVIFEGMDQGVAVYDCDHTLVRFNQQFANLFSFPPGFLRPGMAYEEIVRYRAERGDFGEVNVQEKINNRLEQRAKKIYRRSAKVTLLDGTVIVRHRRMMPDSGVIITYSDITALEKAQQEANEKAALLETTINTLAHGIIVFDGEMRFTLCNDIYMEMFDLPPEVMIPGTSMADIVRYRAKRGDYGAKDPEDYVKAHLERFNRTEESTGDITLSNGKVYFHHRVVMPGGSRVTTFADITERKQMERALRDSEELFRGAFDNAGVGVAIRNADGTSRRRNRAFCDMLGYSTEELKSIRLRDLAHPDDDPESTSLRHISFADTDSQIVERRFIRKDGEVIWCMISYKTVFDTSGKLLYTIGMYQDITDRKHAESQAVEKSYLLEAIFENMTQGIAVYDSDHTLVAFNPQYGEFLGLPSDYLHIGINRRDIFRYRTQLDHFDGAGIDAMIEERLAGSRKPESNERTLPNGRSYAYELTPIPTGGYLIALTDITERRESEKKLQQAQKMEVVGQLTGGIAHDFNNLLAVSMGNIELAEEVAREGGDVGPFLETVMRASERGASLTNQLLAFSRKQTLFPQAIDAGELVDGITSLLRSSLGETIEIEVIGGDDLWSSEVDPHQLESAVLNLALNARDAMPSGGTLTIETTNASFDDDYAASQTEVEPGDYVMVAVTDTGTGMTEDMIEHAFDPFFTTKEVGEGSGLGLSMVYGFVKQSGGHVTLESEEEKGTTVKLYLPRSDKAEESPGPVDRTDVPQAHGETILVVEDDPEVRTLAVALLGSFGYGIIEAGDGQTALNALEAAPRIDLLFTDVVLPGAMSGPELAAEVQNRFPDLAVLYTSGYTDLANVDQSKFGEDTDLLQKPYRKAALARMVRMVLDQAPV